MIPHDALFGVYIQHITLQSDARMVANLNRSYCSLSRATFQLCRLQLLIMPSSRIRGHSLLNLPFSMSAVNNF